MAYFESHFTIPTTHTNAHSCSYIKPFAYLYSVIFFWIFQKQLNSSFTTTPPRHSLHFQNHSFLIMESNIRTMLIFQGIPQYDLNIISTTNSILKPTTCQERKVNISPAVTHHSTRLTYILQSKCERRWGNVVVWFLYKTDSSTPALSFSLPLKSHKSYI